MQQAASFPSEGGITFQFHYPNGSRTRQVFQLQSNIQNLICYAGAVASATEFLSLRSHNPDLTLTTTSTGIVADYISQSTTFFVQWVEAEEESYVDNLTMTDVIPAEAATEVPSTPTVSSVSVTDTSNNLRGLLLSLQSAADLAEPGPTSNCINVVRSNVLESAMRTFKRQAFNPTKQLDVVFVDACGTGERSVDSGGPSREFIRLLMRAILESRYFVGPKNCKSLALDSLAFPDTACNSHLLL
nr:G2/M phase-specific E3 ubiquitin-protein ligase-like [Misgurnus anguillicaudatus]